MHTMGQPQDTFGRLDSNLPAAIQRGPLAELM